MQDSKFKDLNLDYIFNTFNGPTHVRRQMNLGCVGTTPVWSEEVRTSSRKTGGKSGNTLLVQG